MFTGLCTWVCVPVKIKNEILTFIYRFFEIFWLGGAAPQTPQFLAGGAKPPQTPLKRSFVTFDRGGQTGPPRSNDFFFGAADDTGAADDMGAADDRPMSTLLNENLAPVGDPRLR